jgi:hypothetical protein
LRKGVGNTASSASVVGNSCGFTSTAPRATPHGAPGARRGEAVRLRLETGTMGHAVRLI